MAFCANCGTKLPDGAMFCGNCGSKQTPAQPQQPVYTPPVQQPTYEQPVQQPVYTQPEQPAYEQPTQPLTYEQPVNEQPAYDQPAYDQAAYNQQPTYEQPVYGQPAYTQPEAPKKKNIWKILLPIIGGVVLVALIVVLIFVLGKTHVESVNILNEDEILIMAGDSHRVEYEVFPEEHDDEITWGSSDEDVATVRNGRISAQGEGTCTITLYADGEPMAEIEVEVFDEIYVQSLMLDETEIYLTEGENYYVSWSAEPYDHTEKLSWTSSDTAVATVDDYGMITAMGQGSCTVSLNAPSGVSVEVEVYVGSDSSEVDQVVCGEWSSYGAYIDGSSDYYYGVELYLYDDHTGAMYHDGDYITFEWFFDFSDEETHYYDAYAEDGSYFWFTYDYAGEYEGDLDVCLEDNFWVFFE